MRAIASYRPTARRTQANLLLLEAIAQEALELYNIPDHQFIMESLHRYASSLAMVNPADVERGSSTVNRGGLLVNELRVFQPLHENAIANVHNEVMRIPECDPSTNELHLAHHDKLWSYRTARGRLEGFVFINSVM